MIHTNASISSYVTMPARNETCNKPQYFENTTNKQLDITVIRQIVFGTEQ